MTDCTLSRIEFPRCRGRRVTADFGGGDISSNGGALLLALADRRLGLLSGLSRRLVDARRLVASVLAVVEWEADAA